MIFHREMEPSTSFTTIQRNSLLMASILSSAPTKHPNGKQDQQLEYGLKNSILARIPTHNKRNDCWAKHRHLGERKTSPR